MFTFHYQATVYKPHFVCPFSSGVESNLIHFGICFFYGGGKSLVTVRNVCFQAALRGLRTVR